MNWAITCLENRRAALALIMAIAKRNLDDIGRYTAEQQATLDDGKEEMAELEEAIKKLGQKPLALAEVK